MRLNAFLLLIAAVASGCATQQAASGTSDAAARAATQQWATAFNTCSQPSAIASLYEPDALLWGTVSRALTNTSDGLLKYFEGACPANPKPTVELGQYVVQSRGDVATSAGTYTFTIYPGGQPRVVPARFSFTFRRNGDRWLILNHHSSLMPAAPASPAQAPQPRQ